MGYFANVALTIDVFLSVLTGGPYGMTISRRVAEACLLRGSGRACWVCSILSKLVETDHCHKVLANQPTKAETVLRASLLLGPAFLAVVYGVPWLLLKLL